MQDRKPDSQHNTHSVTTMDATVNNRQPSRNVLCQDCEILLFYQSMKDEVERCFGTIWEIEKRSTCPLCRLVASAYPTALDIYNRLGKPRNIEEEIVIIRHRRGSHDEFAFKGMRDGVHFRFLEDKNHTLGLGNRCRLIAGAKISVSLAETPSDLLEVYLM